MAICGIVANDGPPIRDAELEAMGLNLSAAGAWCSPVAGFRATGASRLWSSGDVVVLCDSDLYGPGIPPAGNSAELIGTRYLEQGLSFLQALRGAFALMVWDKRARTLFLAIDRFGVKRLAFAENGPTIIFATTPTGILASGRIAKKINRSAIVDYFCYNVVPAPRTAFAGVSRVAPGESVLWNAQGLRRSRYWDMHYPEDAKGGTANLARELLAHMESSVARAASGLELSSTGCFLSGGTDSSSIVGLLTQSTKAAANAISIGFSESRFDELSYARLAARHFRANHIVSLVGAEAARGVIYKMVAAYDDPYANSSAIPTYACAKLAREHGMDVLLAGDGGDELFGGNERYRTDQIYQLYSGIPRFARERVIEPLLFDVAKGDVFQRVKNYVRSANLRNPDRYCRWRLLQKFQPESVFEDGMPFRNGHSDLLAVMRGHYRTADARSELNRLLYVDVKMTLGDDDLPKVTRMAELAGITVRFPYLDHELAEFSGRLPGSLKVRKLEKRYLFKMATRNLLPPAILAKKKHGFGLPIGLWLKDDLEIHGWAKEVLFDPKTYQRGYFRRQFVEHLFVNMQNDDTPYFGDLLWSFLVLELWHRIHVEGRSC